MSKRFVAILLVCLAVFVGVIALNNNDADAPEANSTSNVSHSLGDENSPVTLIEYGDFQCPACANYYPILKEVKAKYGDQVRFQFRHYPLVSIHPNAMAAHRAAEAAGLQDKFWEMHDLLYENQAEWVTSNNPTNIFRNYADRLNLDVTKYNSDVATAEVKSTIDADIKAGQEANITSTPGFVLNGEKIQENPRDIEGFSALIDPLLEQSTENSGE